MNHSPNYLLGCWFAAATVGALLGVAGFVALAHLALALGWLA